MTKDTKEKIQYSLSVFLIVAGVAMGFISFSLNHFDIETGSALLPVARSWALPCISTSI